MNTINICLACDDNYSKYAGVVIASILENSASSDDLHFYILDGGITEENKIKISELKSIKNCEISFINIDETLFEDYKKIKTHSYITLPAYYRLKIASLLPEVNRIIYFDCDIVVNESLDPLFNTDLGSNPLGGVRDINKRMLKKNPDYINSGMLIMDLKNMREQNIEEELFVWTKDNFNTITMGDQEIINEVLKNKIKIINNEWNVQSSNFTNRSSYTNNPKVIHYVAKKKPWNWASFSYHRDLYFKYLQLTHWKLSEEEYKHWTIDNQLASLIAYVKYRPTFFLRPRFYVALYHTYLKSFLDKNFSIKDYGETHYIIRVLGLKIKFPKLEYAKKKKQSPYYYYKKNNIDITTLPPAEGQIRDIQLANLALLKELDYVCKQAGLKYWLDGGTLLGAVRHKGFIPWDDDIDTAMLREDYDNLIDAFNKYSRNPDIYVGYFRSKKSPNMMFLRVLHKKCPHLSVDIFPWDNYGKDITENEQLKISKVIRTNLKKFEQIADKYTDEELIKKLHEIMQKEILQTTKLHNDNKGNYVWGIDFNHPFDNWFWGYEDLNPLKNIIFEDYEFPCMNKDLYFLRRLYKDYMAYPKKITMGHSMFLELTNEEKEIIKDLINQGEK